MRIRNVCSAALLWSAAILGSGCKGTEPPVATTIVVTPGSVSFAVLNSPQTLSALVLDQKGDSLPGQVIAWSTDNTAVATVTNTGIATAKGNGTATITATTGAISKPVAVTVAQVATTINKSTGDAQLGTVGVALATPLTVHLLDAGGSAIPGAPVAFTVASGGGSLAGAATTTNASGDATAGWTLGTVAGSVQGVSVTSGSLTTSFSATAIAGAVAAVTGQAGNNQTRLTGLPVIVAPSVKVVDVFGNPKANSTVVFAVVSGGGSVTGATQTADAAGIVTVGSWSMGPAAGPNSLSATAQGTAIAFTFTATAASAGAPTTMTMLAGSNNQTGLLSYGTNVRPAVTVTDGGGQPVAGVSVTFAVASGGGGVTTATVNTNAFGIAQVGKWTLGAAAGTNTLTATAAPGGLTGNPATFTATGVTATFNITIQNVGPAFSAAVQAAFDSATAFWQRAIIGDIPDVLNFSSGAGQCGTNSPAIGPITVDDLLILARFDSIDGPGQILGSAGPCFVRTTGRLTIEGTMRFDTADVAGLINNGLLNAVIRHEMGHILGFGTLWTQTAINCVQNLSSTGNVLDTYFSCAKGQAAFDSIGGTSYTGGLKVPVENCGPTSPGGCGSGTVNSHWREPTFFNELMTGYLNSGSANPGSLITIAAMEDLAYQVNYGAAEVYTRVFSAPPAMRAASTLIDLSGDVLRIPIRVMDSSGRVVQVIQP
jgi:hypothetical protein